MGDPGGDGHGRYSERICASNLSGKELKEAYTTGTKLLGFDFTANICSDYGEHRVSTVDAEKLKSLGCTAFDNVSKYDFDEDEGYTIWREEYVAIYLFLCKLGNPEFEYELVSDQMDRIDIGGYGLFDS
jgi:hypothetical protein